MKLTKLKPFTTKQRFKIFYRDYRIYKNGFNSMQNFHISYCPEWVKTAFYNRSKQDETDLIQTRLVMAKLFGLKQFN